MSGGGGWGKPTNTHHDVANGINGIRPIPVLKT